MIQPIETHYNGYRFRSRLEARWAVFFDQLGIVYEYEPEGFDLGDAGWYLPDFWVSDGGEGWFVEVKSRKPLSAEEWNKIRALDEQTPGSGRTNSQRLGRYPAPRSAHPVHIFAPGRARRSPRIPGSLHLAQLLSQRRHPELPNRRSHTSCPKRPL